MAERRWYAVQTTAGHENKVRSLIERRIQDDTRADDEKPIKLAMVPTQDVVEIKNGKKETVKRKIYPGYVLVEMALNQETSHTINGIQGVIKFVGQDRFPQPLRPEEVNRLLGIADEQEEEEPKEEIPFLVGQAVAITEADCLRDLLVSEIDAGHASARTDLSSGTKHVGTRARTEIEHDLAGLQRREVEVIANPGERGQSLRRDRIQQFGRIAQMLGQ